MLIVVSVISASSSLAVVGTYALFKRLHGRLHIKLIVWMSVCDFFANVGSAIGEPEDGTVACWIQALLTTYFYTATLFWATFVTYLLYSLIFSGRVRLSERSMHLMSWIIPLIVTLAPLSTISYGRLYPTQPGWCYLKPPANAAPWVLIFWAFVTFSFWLILSIILMLGFGLRIYLRVRYAGHSTLAKPVLQALDKLKLYPVILILCWGILTVCQLVYEFILHKDSADDETSITTIAFTYFTFIPAVLQGFFSSIIFFWKSDEVWKCWREYFHNEKLGATTGNAGLSDSMIEAQEIHEINSKSNTDDDSRPSATYSAHNNNDNSSSKFSFTMSDNESVFEISSVGEADDYDSLNRFHFRIPSLEANTPPDVQNPMCMSMSNSVL